MYLEKEILNRDVLRENEELFRITFEQAAVGIAHVKPNGKFIRVNKRFCEIVKYSREEMLSMTFQDLTLAEDIDKDLTSLRKMLKGELKTYSREKQHLCKDNSTVWVNLTISLTRNQSNEPNYFISVLEDISNRKVMENALKESESRYRNIIKNTMDVIIVTRFNGKHMYVSPRYKELFGRTPDQLNKSLIEYIHPDDQSKLREIYKKSFENKFAQAPDQEFEFRVQHQNGSYIWVSSITKNYYDEEGKIVGLITSLRDIRKRKETEEKLIESESRYKNIIENTTDVIIVTGFNGKHIYVSPRYKDLLGRTPDQLNKFLIDYLHPDDQSKLRELYEKSFEHKFAEAPDQELEFRVQQQNGIYIWVSSITKNYYDEEGKVVGWITSLRNIRKRKEAEEKLIESEKKYRHLFESSPYFIGLMDENGTLIDSNYSLKEILALQTEEVLIGKTFVEILSIVEKNKKLIPLFKKLFQEAYSKNQLESYDFKLHQSTGGFLWLKIKASTVEINNRILIQFIIQDITIRKIIEENLKESEIKFRTIAEQSLMGIGILQDEKIKYANKKLANMYSYTVEEVINQKYFDFLKLIHPEDRGNLIKKVEKRKDRISDTIKYYQFRSLKKTGERFWVEVYSRIINYQGKRASLFFILDITEMKEAELKLKESEEKFRKIFEANPSGMHLYDLTAKGDLIFKGANYAADKILKIENSQNIGKTIEEAFPPLIGTEIPTKYRLVASEGLTLNLEYFNYNRDKNNRIYEIYAFQTAPGSMVTSFIDISDRIEAEQRLKEINRLKSELLRRASHELRTPLTSINGAVELLLTTFKKDFDETTEEFLNIIKKGGKRLENLIKDLLNVSNLQTEIVEINKLREDIVKLIIDSIDEIEIFAKERDININFNQEESIYIDVDKNKIRQVFVNLLMNAIKYTPPKGEVSIKIEIPTEDSIDIVIKDTGIGFTEEEKKIIFKQFGKIERFGQGFDVNTEGSGLGLYISKELVELHSGNLWVESEGRNKGSSFIIRIPQF